MFASADRSVAFIWCMSMKPRTQVVWAWCSSPWFIQVRCSLKLAPRAPRALVEECFVPILETCVCRWDMRDFMGREYGGLGGVVGKLGSGVPEVYLVLDTALGMLTLHSTRGTL